MCVMSKTDGVDDAMEPLSDDVGAGSGFKVVPLGMYRAMLRMLKLLVGAGVGCVKRVWRGAFGCGAGAQEGGGGLRRDGVAVHGVGRLW